MYSVCTFKGAILDPLNVIIQVSQSDLLIHDRWRSLNLWKGHLTIPKRSQRIARTISFISYLLLYFPPAHFIAACMKRPPVIVTLLMKELERQNLIDGIDTRMIRYLSARTLTIGWRSIMWFLVRACGHVDLVRLLLQSVFVQLYWFHSITFWGLRTASFARA